MSAREASLSRVQPQRSRAACSPPTEEPGSGSVSNSTSHAPCRALYSTCRAMRGAPSAVAAGSCASTDEARVTSENFISLQGSGHQLALALRAFT